MFKKLFMRKFLIVYQYQREGVTTYTSSCCFEVYDIYTEEVREEIEQRIAKGHHITRDKVLILNIIQLKQQFLWWYF